MAADLAVVPKNVWTITVFVQFLWQSLFGKEGRGRPRKVVLLWCHTELDSPNEEGTLTCFLDLPH